jgi:hypothetical protein
MNEQIYKIARRADVLAREIEPNLKEIALYKRIRDEKFAELIVKECMSMCITAVGNADYNTGRMHCYNNIKEHFGVDI